MRRHRRRSGPAETLDRRHAQLFHRELPKPCVSATAFRWSEKSAGARLPLARNVRPRESQTEGAAGLQPLAGRQCPVLKGRKGEPRPKLSTPQSDCGMSTFAACILARQESDPIPEDYRFQEFLSVDIHKSPRGRAGKISRLLYHRWRPKRRRSSCYARSEETCWQQD